MRSDDAEVELESDEDEDEDGGESCSRLGIEYGPLSYLEVAQDGSMSQSKTTTTTTTKDEGKGWSKATPNEG